MSFSRLFTVARLTEPDPAQLIANLRALDPTAGVAHELGPIYLLDKNTAWGVGQITAAQNVLETTVVVSARTLAQAEVDQWPIAVRALVLALIDQLNVLRAAQVPPLAAITPAQAMAAIRNKAATL